jgi:mRNA interferase HigB
MRVIKRATLDRYARKHGDAAAAILQWFQIVRSAKWSNLADVRRDFPSADGVRVDSGKTATVFNIRGNNYRLITAIHYDRQKVYVMRFLTHAEYDKDTWKDTL